MIITIDGPVGSGKTSAARLLARRMGYACMDTGAMYRAIGWKAVMEKIDMNEERLEELCKKTSIEIYPVTDSQSKVMVNGKDVTEEIRAPEISRMASSVSMYSSVRKYLVRMQRTIGHRWNAEYGGVVIEGRDIGTVVFPDADVKFYFDAGIEERGRRRWKELRAKGLDVSLKDTIKDLIKRDRDDTTRSVAPLKKAEDALVIDTTGRDIEKVVDMMMEVINNKLVKPG